MKKEEVFNIINSLIQDNKMYHSLLLSSNDQQTIIEVTNEIIRQLVCKNNSFKNDDCIYCKKAINNNLLNTFFIGNTIEPIKKIEIKELISKFSLTTIEEIKQKIYIIQNAENLNEEAANSLLKFLEEPPKDVYAILLTNDRTQILSTIKSRCKLFIIDNIKGEEQINYEFIDILKLKNKNDLMLFLLEFKKRSKEEIINILQDTFTNYVRENLTYLSELFLNSIEEIKKTNYYNLVIENLFINIYEVI